VYKAAQIATSKIVALKKSRASLALNHTLLNHERRLLQLLNGHSSIPEVLAYGRLKHFEYLAMELAGIALNDVYEQGLSLPAANILVIADQMVHLKHQFTIELLAVTPTPDLSSQACSQEWIRPLRFEAREHPPPPH
jgi:serine/threonine protein kinase